MSSFSSTRLILFISMVMLLLYVGSSSTYGQNLVINGNFSASAANWGSFAPATGTEAYNPETSYGGSIATNIVAEIDNGANLRQTNIAVVPGTNYYLSFKQTRRTLGGAPSPTGVRVKVYNGSNVFLTQDIFPSNTTWNWQCELLQFTPSTNTVTLDFENITAVASTLGTMIDDVTISPTNQIITFSGVTCQGGSFTLSAPASTANSQYSNFNWTGPNGFSNANSQVSFTNAQPSLNGTYTCTMLLNGCMPVTGTYVVNVVPTTFNRTIDICSGETYNFYGRTLYQPGVYDTLVVAGGNSCDSLIILQLNINPIPDASITPAGNIELCAGDTAKLSVINPVTSTSYQWYNGGGLIQGQTSQIFTTTFSGSYYLIATSAKGCEGKSSVTEVKFHALPLAQINPDQIGEHCISDTVKLSAAPGPVLYTWSPGNLFRPTGNNEGMEVRALLRKAIDTVVLTTYNDAGCRSYDTLILYAKSCCDLFLPTAFSPNNDGLNDFFSPYLDRSQKILNLSIYDRYGKLIFKTVTGKGWNGRYPNGEFADVGVYMYLLEYTCGEREIQSKKGDVTVIR